MKNFVSTDVWHISRYFENLKFYNSFRIIFYKISCDYILKHNRNCSLKTHINCLVPRLAFFSFFFPVYYIYLIFWKLSSGNLLLSSDFPFLKALEKFLYTLYHCFIVLYHESIVSQLIRKAEVLAVLCCTQWNTVCCEILEVWCLEGAIVLVHNVMTCLCQRFLYISFISWKKVYFYVFSSMNGTL